MKSVREIVTQAINETDVDHIVTVVMADQLIDEIATALEHEGY